MEFKVISNLDECKKLWSKFWHGDELFDEWDYRSCFYDPALHKLHFLVCFDSNEAIGFLPLWKSASADYYEWFGGEFPEHNRLTFPIELLGEFIKHMPSDVWLPYIQPYPGLELSDEGSFSLSIDSFSSIEDYLSLFSKKHRKNLKRDLEQIKDFEIKRNDTSDLDHMARMNIKRFSSDSFFSEKMYIDAFKRIVELAKKKGELEMISIDVKGRTCASEVAILHNGTYTVLLGGADLDVNNIGKLLILEHFKNAISKKAKIIDFLAHDSGWKKLWNLEERKWCEINKP